MKHDYNAKYKHAKHEKHVKYVMHDLAREAFEIRSQFVKQQFSMGSINISSTIALILPLCPTLSLNTPHKSLLDSLSHKKMQKFSKHIQD